jgi:hypothetical protein
MPNWYKISQQQALNQEWVHAMERTFDLTDFGRTKLRLKGWSPDKAGRDSLIFFSAPDPTLSEYDVRVRLDLQKSRVDISIMENKAFIGAQSIPVNHMTLMQSPQQVAQTVKTILETRNNNGRQEAGTYDRVAG